MADPTNPETSARAADPAGASAGDGLSTGSSGTTALPSLAPRRGIDDPGAPQEGDMPFLDHLEELRWRILKGLAGVVVAAGLCLAFAGWIIDDLLLAPTRPDFFMYPILRLDAVEVILQNRTITGQFFAYFGTVLAAGLVLGSPMVVYQTWKFIEPGLYREERSGLRFSAVFATFFFALGISFGYLVITPIALQFFSQFQVSAQITNEFDISKYFSMMLAWTFGAGALFELPVVVTFLTRLGVVTPDILRTGRRYAIVVILVVGAMLTPPDPLSQIMMAVPLYGLYELSILLSARVLRKQARELAKAEKKRAASTNTSA